MPLQVLYDLKNYLNQQFSVNNKQFIYIIGNMLNRKCTETAPSFLHLNKTKQNIILVPIQY